MKKIFILGGSYLQMDLILEAKKMFFYTVVLDFDQECIGSKWCDEFLHIDIADKEAVLKKAKKYNIDAILTSATELGNITACYVGEKLKLNTNSYKTALNTTNKTLMKKIFFDNKLKTAKYQVITNKKELKEWNSFPCIIKPSDSSAGRGLSYAISTKELLSFYAKAKKYTSDAKIIVEEYIKGEQYSIETISSNSKHQIVTINREFIHNKPHIMERSHTIPAKIDKKIKKKINKIVHKILNAFHIKYGASHIEIKVTDKKEIYIIELASRTGGMRSEMINLAYGISYSQLLLLSALNNLPMMNFKHIRTVHCNFIINYEAYKYYLKQKKDENYILLEPFSIPTVKKNFIAEHIGKSKGYYYLFKGKI